MAKIVVPEGKLDLGAHPKPFSQKVPGGRLVLDYWRGVPRVRFFRDDVERVRSPRMSYWQVWLEAANLGWAYTTPKHRESFERATQAFRFLTARDVFFLIGSGRFWFEIETDQGVLRPAWARPYFSGG